MDEPSPVPPLHHPPTGVETPAAVDALHLEAVPDVDPRGTGALAGAAAEAEMGETRVELQGKGVPVHGQELDAAVGTDRAAEAAPDQDQITINQNKGRDKGYSGNHADSPLQQAGEEIIGRDEVPDEICRDDPGKEQVEEVQSCAPEIFPRDGGSHSPVDE